MKEARERETWMNGVSLPHFRGRRFKTPKSMEGHAPPVNKPPIKREKLIEHSYQFFHSSFSSRFFSCS